MTSQIVRGMWLTVTAVILWCLAGPLAVAQGTPTFDDVIAQASAARERNDILRAIELYSKAVQLRPKWTSGWWSLGSLEYAARSYAAARDALTHFIESSPEPGPAFGLRGLCEFETGEYERSLADFQDAITLGGPDQSVKEETLHYYKGLALIMLSRFDAALKDDSFFAQQRTASPEVLVAVGLAGLRMPVLPSEVKADQRELLTGAGRAVLQFIAGDEKSATGSFDSIIQRFPRVTGLHGLYGHFLLASNLDRAVAEFKRELEVSPTDMHANTMLAWGLLMQRNAVAALPYAEAAVQEAPGVPPAELVLGRSLTETGRVIEGIPHLERALQLAPDDLEIHIALADAYSRAGRRQEAQHERLQCLQMTKDGANRVALP